MIGAEFYLMQRRRGVILRGSRAPKELESSAELTRNLCFSFVDRLVELHQIDYQSAGPWRSGTAGRIHRATGSRLDSTLCQRTH